MAVVKYGHQVESMPGAANLNTDAALVNRVLTVDANGRAALTTAVTDAILGVGATPAVSATAGTAVGFSVKGRVQVITANATAIAVGDALSGTADGKVVEKTEEADDRLISLGASSAADTVIDAYLI